MCSKPLLFDANYDRKNNDLTNDLHPRRFKLYDVSTNFMMLFYMLNTFYLLSFSQVLTFINYVSSMPQNVTWTDNPRD